MKTRIILGLAAGLALLPSVSFAQDVIIRERPPAVVVDPPGGAIEHGPPPAAIEERETTGAGPRDEGDCRFTTVRKENPDGSTTTIRKKDCD
jgi:hypothetical protein